MKRFLGILLAGSALLGLGGCVYPAGYYARPGVAYDDGTASYAPVAGYDGGYYDGYYAPGYYYGPGYCCYGGAWPWVGIGFYGSYYYGGHGYRHDGRGGWHGGSHSVPHSLQPHR